jgi:hypothetical protein
VVQLTSLRSPPIAGFNDRSVKPVSPCLEQRRPIKESWTYADVNDIHQELPYTMLPEAAKDGTHSSHDAHPCCGTRVRAGVHRGHAVCFTVDADPKLYRHALRRSTQLASCEGAALTGAPPKGARCHQPIQVNHFHPARSINPQPKLSLAMDSPDVHAIEAAHEKRTKTPQPLSR